MGKINTYGVFAETFRRLLHPLGRAGLVVLSGIATDDTNKQFFVHLVSTQTLLSLFDFENRARVFPGIHADTKFCLLTIAGHGVPDHEPAFAFFLHSTEQLTDSMRRFTLSPNDYMLFNPNTMNCPIFRTSRDAYIARKMHSRAGILLREGKDGLTLSNPWGVRIHNMFNMTTGSGIFRTEKDLVEGGYLSEGGDVFTNGAEEYLPLYESKLFHHYDHRYATFEGLGDEDILKGNAREITDEEKSLKDCVVVPRYWVPSKEVREKISSINPAVLSDREEEILDDMERLTSEVLSGYGSLPPAGRSPSRGWLQAIRSITNPTNARTTFVSNIPEAGLGHSARVMSYGRTGAVAAAFVMANLNSLPLDWASRLSVGGKNMSLYIVKQLPVLPPTVYFEDALHGGPYGELVVRRVLELTYTSSALEPFARELGYGGPPFPWDEQRRHLLKCELDATFARIYGLDRPELEWILDAPAPSASFPALKRSEIREFGEYRTQRYVLEAYDKMARGELPDLEPAAGRRGAGGEGE